MAEGLHFFQWVVGPLRQRAFAAGAQHEVDLDSAALAEGLKQADAVEGARSPGHPDHQALRRRHEPAAPARTIGPVGASVPAAGSRVTANVLTRATSSRAGRRNSAPPRAST